MRNCRASAAKPVKEIVSVELAHDLVGEPALAPGLDLGDRTAAAGDDIDVLCRACLEAVVGDGRVQDYGALVTSHRNLPVDIRPPGSGGDAGQGVEKLLWLEQIWNVRHAL
jgi:hypothetical protein